MNCEQRLRAVRLAKRASLPRYDRNAAGKGARHAYSLLNSTLSLIAFNTRSGVSGNESNQMPMASFTAAHAVGAYGRYGIRAHEVAQSRSGVSHQIVKATAQKFHRLPFQLALPALIFFKYRPGARAE